jgi:hypothetical protein
MPWVTRSRPPSSPSPAGSRPSTPRSPRSTLTLTPWCVSRTRPARGLRRRLGHRRHLPRRRRQPRPDPLRGGLGQDLWGRPGASRLRQDQRPAPPQPRRQPPSEPRPVAGRADPPRPRRTPHRRLHATSSRPGPHQTRDHPGAQTLRRTRNLPTAPDLSTGSRHRDTVTGLAQDCPDTPNGRRPPIDLPSRHRHPRRTRIGLMRACPTWPITGVPASRR